MISKIVIVFSGFNQRAVIAFLRTLEKNNVGYAIIASNEHDEILLTKYSSAVCYIRKNYELNLEDISTGINAIKDKYKSDVGFIAPSTEGLNRFILDNRKKIEGLGCEIPLVDKFNYEQVSDKYKFSVMCIEEGLDVPIEYVSIEDVKIPFVAKPKEYYSSSGQTLCPVLVTDRRIYKNFILDKNLEDYYFQDFICGDSLYLLFYFYRDGTVDKGSQVNLVQQPQGKSIVAARSSNFHDKSETYRYIKMLKKHNFHGLIMIELKEHKGKYYMIEANPRFWGPSQLFVDADCNLFESLLYDYGLIETRPRLSALGRNTKYFWSGGIDNNGLDDLTYFSYSKEELKLSIDDWLSIDVYNREDTKDLYEKTN